MAVPPVEVLSRIMSSSSILRATNPPRKKDTGLASAILIPEGVNACGKTGAEISAASGLARDDREVEVAVVCTDVRKGW